MIILRNLPKCPSCQSDMLPFEDVSRANEVVHLKGWGCSNPKCGNNLFYKDGKLETVKILTKPEGAVKV